MLPTERELMVFEDFDAVSPDANWLGSLQTLPPNKNPGIAAGVLHFSITA